MKQSHPRNVLVNDMIRAKHVIIDFRDAERRTWKKLEEPALEDPRHAIARIAWQRQCLEQSFRDSESDRVSCDLPQNHKMQKM